MLSNGITYEYRLHGSFVVINVVSIYTPLKEGLVYFKQFSGLADTVVLIPDTPIRFIACDFIKWLVEVCPNLHHIVHCCCFHAPLASNAFPYQGTSDPFPHQRAGCKDKTKFLSGI